MNTASKWRRRLDSDDSETTGEQRDSFACIRCADFPATQGVRRGVEGAEKDCNGTTPYSGLKFQKRRWMWRASVSNCDIFPRAYAGVSSPVQLSWELISKRCQRGKV